MHRPATRIAAATFILGLLVTGPAATATPGSGPTEGQVQLAASVSTGAGHDDHDAGNQDVAEWPEWARTGSDGMADEEPAHGGHDETPADPATQHTRQHGSDHGTEQETSHGEHGDRSGPAPERPRALALGSFAAVNGAVLLAAAVMRRRTKSEVDRRKSARAAALRDPGTSARSGSSSRTH